MSKTHVPLERIEPNPYQSRIDTGDVESLAEKVLEHGLRQLPEGRLLQDGEVVTGPFSRHTTTHKNEWHLSMGSEATVQLATGHRRVEAVRLLAQSSSVSDKQLREVGLRPGAVPIDLQRLTDDQMLDLLTVENAAREELSPIEQARLIQKHADTGRKTKAIAEAFGYSSSWVSNRKRLLDYPQSIQEHIHEGGLSVRQATALKPIFEADTESVEFPEGNSFAPEQVIEDALNGTASGALRKKVRQFESWMRQLSGKTQEEIREQEYEQDLDSDQQADGSAQDRQSRQDAREDAPVDQPPAPEAPGDRADSRGSSERQAAPVRQDKGRTQEGHDEGQRDGTPGQASPVGGDGAPSPETDDDAHRVQVIILEVAGWLAEQIDRDVLTRHLMVLGIPQERQIRQHIQEILNSRLRQEGYASRPQAAAEWLNEWLRELGYNIDLPEASPVGQVHPGEVTWLLSIAEDEWEDCNVTRPSIACLYVAYRVAEERQERWRREKIAQLIGEEYGAVTEEDFPDQVWADAQDEIGRRLEPQEA